VHSAVGGRAALVAAGDIATAEDAMVALAHLEIVALGRAVLVDPDFAAKIEAGHPEDIETSVSGRLDQLAFPPILKDFWMLEGTPLPPLKGLNA
jgi:2,4-dienoyl-CoA reductase-like NADH-dependent reductase (Old Yellow Enzyme family)